MGTAQTDAYLAQAQNLPPRANRDLAHIPGQDGLPLVGDALPFMRDTLNFQREMYGKYGPVFRVRIGPDPSINLIHPDAHKLLTLDTDRLFSTAAGYANTLAELFPKGLLLRDFSDHRMHRRIMQTAFKNTMLASYLPQIQSIARQHVQQWAASGEVQFLGAVKACLLEIGSTVFLGMQLGDDARRVNQAFIDMAEGASTPLRFNIPGTPYHRAFRSYRFICDYFREQIPAKRESQSTDMFSLFCKETREDGEYFSDDDIVHHINFLLFAAHDTTTSTLSNLLMEFAQNPDWAERCRDELCALGHDDLAYADLDNFETTSWCFKETLRLYPPVIGFARRALRDFEFMGYPIPQNAMVSVSPLLAQRLPEFFSDPDAFDPARFGPGREEHKSHPFAWFPFGGGAHKCIGLHFAEMLVKVVLFEMLRNYRFEAAAPPGRMRYIPFPKPVNNVPLRIERR